MNDEIGMVQLESVNQRYLGNETSSTASSAVQERVDKEVIALIKEQYEKSENNPE